MAVSSILRGNASDGVLTAHSYNYRMDDPLGVTKLVDYRKRRLTLLVTANGSSNIPPFIHNSLFIGGPPGIGVEYEVPFAPPGLLFVINIRLLADDYYEFVESEVWWEQRNISSVTVLITEVGCTCDENN